MRHADQGENHLRRALRVLGPPAARLCAGAALRLDRSLVLQRVHHQVVRDAPAHGLVAGLLSKERARGTSPLRFTNKWTFPFWLLKSYQLYYSSFCAQKLKDPQYVARTISKYEGRMFQLWRGLERTYKVKWQPPQSILDSSSSSLLSDEF